MSSSFEESKQFLQKQSGTGNLYDHISQVILRILTERPSDGLERLELISSEVKSLAFVDRKQNEAEEINSETVLSHLVCIIIVINFLSWRFVENKAT